MKIIKDNHKVIVQRLPIYKRILWSIVVIVILLIGMGILKAIHLGGNIETSILLFLALGSIIQLLFFGVFGWKKRGALISFAIPIAFLVLSALFLAIFVSFSATKK